MRSAWSVHDSWRSFIMPVTTEPRGISPRHEVTADEFRWVLNVTGNAGVAGAGNGRASPGHPVKHDRDNVDAPLPGDRGAHGPFDSRSVVQHEVVGARAAESGRATLHAPSASRECNRPCTDAPYAASRSAGSRWPLCREDDEPWGAPGRLYTQGVRYSGMRYGDLHRAPSRPLHQRAR
jgi:hypothetical protein